MSSKAHNLAKQEHRIHFLAEIDYAKGNFKTASQSPHYGDKVLGRSQRFQWKDSHSMER